MNKKNIFWLLGILVIIVGAIAVFRHNTQESMDDPYLADEDMSLDTSDELPLADDEYDRLLDEDEMNAGDGDTSISRDEFLLNIQSRLSEVKSDLEEYSSQASERAADTLAQVEDKITQLENTVESAKSGAGENWQEVKREIEQQYEDIVEIMNAVLLNEDQHGQNTP